MKVLRILTVVAGIAVSCDAWISPQAPSQTGLHYRNGHYDQELLQDAQAFEIMQVERKLLIAFAERAALVAQQQEILANALREQAAVMYEQQGDMIDALDTYKHPPHSTDDGSDPSIGVVQDILKAQAYQRAFDRVRRNDGVHAKTAAPTISTSRSSTKKIIPLMYQVN